MIKPSDIVDEMEACMKKWSRTGKGTSPLPGSAYLWLERAGEINWGTPAGSLRDQLILERGIPGKGSGVHYSAASVISDALEMLARHNKVEITYHDVSNTLYRVAGQLIEPGFSGGVVAHYRLL